MDYQKYKEFALEILNLPSNDLIDVDDIRVENNVLQILKTYEINDPEPRPKPENLLSEWPPNNKLWFYHDYFRTPLQFLTIGDHIAKIEPKNKNRVVALSRVAALEELLRVLRYKCHRYKRDDECECFIVQFFLQSSKKEFYTIELLKNFFKDDSVFEEWKIKYSVHQKELKNSEKKKISKMLERKLESREDCLKKCIERFNAKFESDVKELRKKISLLD